ncbi:hypothetical protein [Lachnoclostridium sp. An131]|nr:hypothetical protein [Lachnoclostridium sp. An131]
MGKKENPLLAYYDQDGRFAESIGTGIGTYLRNLIIPWYVFLSAQS